MRELKFRAWDGHKMWYSVTLMDGKHWDAYNDCEIMGTEIMQSTGLKDKNNYLIYEGDVIKFFNKVVAVIVWDFNSWCFKWIDPTYKVIRRFDVEPVFRNINLSEVAGNIYETPNLLTP